MRCGLKSASEASLRLMRSGQLGVKHLFTLSLRLTLLSTPHLRLSALILLTILLVNDKNLTLTI